MTIRRLKPEPQEIDASKAVFISGLDTTWTLDCPDKCTHTVYNGPSYTIVIKKDIWGCKLLSRDTFIEPQQIGCMEVKTMKFRPLHPLNAAAATIVATIPRLSKPTIEHIVQ